MGAQENRSGRNQRMDLYRGLAIYAVITIHVLFPGSVGSAVRVLARFAVPFFFLTAGYFSLGAPANALEKRAVRTLKQLCVACIPYILLSCALTAGQGGSVLKWIAGRFTWARLVNLLGAQTITLSYGWQLWFLAALFVVYLWWWLLTGVCEQFGKKIPYDICAAVALGLLALHLFLGELCGLMGREVDNRVLRNALLDGLPFFALGAWCAFRRREIRQWNVPWHILVPVGAVLSLIEAKLAGRQELYLGTLMILAGMMGRCLCCRKVPAGRISEFLQYCGANLTLYIYIVHLLVLALIREGPVLGWLAALEWLLPIIVAALSTLIALGLAQLKERLPLERRFIL